MRSYATIRRLPRQAAATSGRKPGSTGRWPVDAGGSPASRARKRSANFIRTPPVFATVEKVGFGEPPKPTGGPPVLNCFAHMRRRSVNGAMKAFFDWWEKLPAAFDFAITRGKIRARLPVTAQFNVNAQTASGHVANEFKFKVCARSSRYALPPRRHRFFSHARRHHQH
jgi:hypothetical protein